MTLNAIYRDIKYSLTSAEKAVVHLFEGLEKLRWTENLNRLAYIIDGILSNLSLSAGHSVQPRLHSHAKSFAKVTDFIGALRIAFNWKYRLTGETVYNKQVLVNELGILIGEINPLMSEAICRTTGANVLKEAFTYKSPKEIGRYENRRKLEEKLVQLLAQRGFRTDLEELDRLPIPRMSILEKLSWVGFTTTTVLATVAQLQDWGVYDLSNVAGRLGVNRVLGSPSVLWSGVLGALCAGHAFKFCETANRSVEMSNRNDRIRNVWDMFLSLTSAALYGASLVGFVPRTINNLTIAIKGLALVSEFVRPEPLF